MCLCERNHLLTVGGVIVEVMESCFTGIPMRVGPVEVEDIKRNLLGELEAVEPQVGPTHPSVMMKWKLIIMLMQSEENHLTSLVTFIHRRRTCRCTLEFVLLLQLRTTAESPR